jgi:hypothetical protein
MRIKIKMKIPKVFISYSHDSQEHKKWVLDLATRLRKFLKFIYRIIVNYLRPLHK